MKACDGGDDCPSVRGSCDGGRCSASEAGTGSVRVDAGPKDLDAGDCAAGQTRCDADGMLQSCSRSGDWGDGRACPFLCNDGECTGECVPQTMDCADASTPRACNDQGVWKRQPACPAVCADGECVAACAQGAFQCTLDGLLRCDDAGAWEPHEQCAYGCAMAACIECGVSDGICPQGCPGDDPDCARSLGASCTTGGECQSGRCADGVCCDLGCLGPCDFCNLAGNVGTCTDMDFSSDPAHCGACNAVCSDNHVTPTCQGGDCGGDCSGVFRDCNDDLREDGCETDTSQNDAHCGACDRACLNAHGSTQCSSGICAPTCANEYFDCDGNPTNGCERHCAFPNAAVGCSNSTCQIGACNPGWGNCTADTSDGCDCKQIVLEGTWHAANANGVMGVSTQYTLHHDFGAGRMLVLLIAAGASTETASAPYTAFQGTTRQFVRVHTVGSTNQWAFIYYMDDANLPPVAGTYQLRVYEAGVDLHATLLEFSNVDQDDPFYVRGGSNHGDCTMDDPSDTLTVTGESWLLSSVALNGSGAALTGQTVTHNEKVGNLRSMHGYLPNVPAGNRTISWSADGCGKSAHALVAIRPR